MAPTLCLRKLGEVAWVWSGEPGNLGGDAARTRVGSEGHSMVQTACRTRSHPPQHVVLGKPFHNSGVTWDEVVMVEGVLR